MSYLLIFMRKIELTNAFKRDFKREEKGCHRKLLDTELKEVIKALAADTPLTTKYRDHGLTGNWESYRDCHIKPDLILLYQKPDNARLILVRLGSHSELRL